MGSWEAPNKSTLQGMGPVHASKASRRGLRLDHLFNEREGSHGARGRLERDMQTYWGTLKALDVSEAELLTKARENSKIQKHVIGFIEAADKASYVLELFDRYVVNNADFPNSQCSCIASTNPCSSALVEHYRNRSSTYTTRHPRRDRKQPPFRCLEDWSPLSQPESSQPSWPSTA